MVSGRWNIRGQYIGPNAIHHRSAHTPEWIFNHTQIIRVPPEKTFHPTYTLSCYKTHSISFPFFVPLFPSHEFSGFVFIHRLDGWNKNREGVSNVGRSLSPLFKIAFTVNTNILRRNRMGTKPTMYEILSSSSSSSNTTIQSRVVRLCQRIHLFQTSNMLPS